MAPSQESTRRDLDILQIVLKHKWVLCLGMILGVVLGVAGYLKLGPEYEAVAKVLVSKQASVPINEAEGSRTFGDRAEHIALIMSPLIVSKAVEKHRLNQLPSLAASTDPADDILDSLKVKRSAGHDNSFLNVLDISYKNPDKKDAAAVVTAVIDAYRDYLAESHQEKTTEIVELISKARNDLMQQIQKKKEEYLAFRNESPLHWRRPMGAEAVPGDVTNPHQGTLKAIETELDGNMLEATRIKSRIEALEQAVASGQSRESLDKLVQIFLASSAGSAGSAGLSVPAGTEAMQNQLLPLLLEEQKLLRDFGPDHPDVQTARSKVEMIYDFYRKRGITVPEDPSAGPARSSGGPANQVDLVAVYLQSLRQQEIQLTLRNTELTRLHEKESQLAKGFARYEEQDQTFNDGIVQLKSLWDVVVTRLNQLELVKDNRGYTLKQISPVQAELAVKRILKFVGAGTIFGIALALGIVYLREWQDTTFKSVSEIRRSVELPVLGSIPTFELGRWKTDGSTPLVPALCYYHRPGSPEAESYRSVRTTLLVSASDKRHAVIQVTSPESGDGKTTMAANLALAMAQSGKSVLLVDADLRRPTVHQLFGVSQEIGLADILTGEIDSPNAVRETIVPGLSLLTSGATPENPAELLASSRLDELLGRLGKEFDFVLVDTPPLLAVSDASIVARRMDGVVLVLRIAKNRRQSAQRATELLEALDVSVLGVVANGIERSDSEGYGYGENYRAYVRSEADPSSTAAAEQGDRATAKHEPAAV